MEIKRTLIAIFVFASFGVLSQPLEEQLKFRLPDTLGEYALLFGMDGVGGMSSVQHIEYLNYDIYLDTPDDLLLKEGWSLRIRKRNTSDSTVSYSMQLKSEMGDTNALRFEIEEKELDFYRWVDPSNKVFKVTDLIDSICFVAEHPLLTRNQESFQMSCSRLNQWLTSMVGGTITPFHYLHYYDALTFNNRVLKSLEVKMVGKSHRIRGHVYYDSELESKIERIPANQAELPVFFQEHSEAIWLMETSLDYAIFYCSDDLNTPIHIREFEVENKYGNRALSASILEKFSAALVSEFGLIKTRESKYSQVRARTKE